MSLSNITLNVIPLDTGETSKRFSFFKSKPEGIFSVPLTPEEMPIDPGDIFEEGEPVYTTFKESPGARLTLTVDFEHASRFAKHYMNHRIYEWFEGKARLRSRDFVHNNVFYFLQNEDKTNHLARFDRFIVRAGYGRFTDGFELTIMYRGMMSAWLKPLYDYPGPSTDFNKVIYRGEVHKYEKLIQQEDVNRKEAYPMLNSRIADTLELSRKPKDEKINKLKRHTEKIDWFYNRYIMSDGFRETFKPSGDGFLKVPPAKLHKLDNRAANLVFGENKVNKDPHTGMKAGGPYKPPLVSHIRLFFICHEGDTKDIGNRLYRNFNEGKDFFPGLKKYARIPAHITKNHITFSNADNPFPEIREKLRGMRFDDNFRYCAIYISPISRDDRDPIKHRVYYKLKEELLKYKITSQVIGRNSVTDPNFCYYLTNISVALIAKLGGVPWTLEKKKREELVIGVGAYSPNERRKTYLGSAFCFSNSGEFRGFNSFTADRPVLLAGSFKKAIRQFREENENVARVVIHFYKKMKREEAEMVKQVLRDLGLDVPVIILTIHKTLSTDLVLADRNRSDLLPPSGMWMRSGKRQYLLCNNTRFDEPSDVIRNHPYPLKVYFDLAEDPPDVFRGGYNKWVQKYLLKDGRLEELLEQVYQFSRLNWQTITVKSLPVSVRYPEMVAQKFPYFEGEVLPEFGKRNFWFL